MPFTCNRSVADKDESDSSLMEKTNRLPNSSTHPRTIYEIKRLTDSKNEYKVSLGVIKAFEMSHDISVYFPKLNYIKSDMEFPILYKKKYYTFISTNTIQYLKYFVISPRYY